MQTRLAALAVLGFVSLSRAAEPVDPFAVPWVARIDRNGDGKSDKFLSDDLLKAFDERPYWTNLHCKRKRSTQPH